MVHVCSGVIILLLLLIFLYYIISMHDIGNRSIGRSVVKCQGNAREFHIAWRVVTLRQVLPVHKSQAVLNETFWVGRK